MCDPHANVSREAHLSLGNPDLTSLPTYDWQTYWLCIWYSGRQAGTTWLQPMCYMPSPILKLPEAHHRMSPLAHLQGGGRHCRERQVLCSVSGHSRLLSETRDRDQPDAATHSTVLPRVAYLPQWVFLICISGGKHSSDLWEGPGMGNPGLRSSICLSFVVES